MNLKRMLSAAVLMVVVCNITALAQSSAKSEFIVCQSTFALCVFAQCKPIKELETTLLFSCTCNVQVGESVGAHPCEEMKKVPEGLLIRSRYAPGFKTYARCSNNRPWAMCLDSPCVMDKPNSPQAKCTCPIVQGQGDYMVQPGTDQCSNGAISSATVDDLDQITDFLETQPNLLPKDIQVVNVLPK